MSKVKYEFFGTDAEISAFTPDGDGRLTLCFPAGTEGYLSIDGVVVKITDATAHLDLRYVSDGEFRPILVLRHGRISLPTLKKAGKHVKICDPTPDYIRELSLRERRLSERVSELEAELCRIHESIYGRTIL